MRVPVFRYPPGGCGSWMFGAGVYFSLVDVVLVFVLGLFVTFAVGHFTRPCVRHVSGEGWWGCLGGVS